METLWFALVSFMLIVYVVLDGFDFGAGIIHLYVARTDLERRMNLNAIGPVWDGNEVWILAAGGTLYFAFPLVYASSFSGFYLPLIIILWLLMLRGLGIEFRHQVHDPMWTSFWDVVFSLASILLAIFFGAALGNIVRGVPLNQEGYFFEPLWTTFTIVPESGILDWFTVILGLVAFTTLTVHGANYVALKTEGAMQERARLVARTGWWGVVLTAVASIVSMFSIRPEMGANFTARPWGFLFPLCGLLALGGMWLYNKRGRDAYAFLASSAFIAAMLGGTAFAMYPYLLHSSIDPAFSLAAHKVAAQQYGLTVGLVWWILGIALATGYFVHLYKSFRGKVTLPADGSGY